MKKSLTIIASAILAMGMLFVTGCKKDAPNLGSDDVGSWKATEYDKAGFIQLTADNKDAAADEYIDWWAVTNTSGVVLADSNGKVTIKEGNPAEINLTEAVKGKDKLEVVLWIHQPNVVAKNLPKEATEADKKAGAKTFRGSVVLKTGKGLSVKASDYKEAVQEVSVLAVKCNETNKDGATKGNEKAKWSGNYRITELYPLQQTEPNVESYMLIGGLKVVNFGNIEEGKTVKVIWPAGNSRVAFRQPDRFVTDGTGLDKEADAAAKQANWCWSVNMTGNNALTAWSDVKTITSVSSDKYVVIGKDVPTDKPFGGEDMGEADATVPDTGRAVTSNIFFTEDDFFDAADLK